MTNLCSCNCKNSFDQHRNLTLISFYQSNGNPVVLMDTHCNMLQALTECFMSMLFYDMIKWSLSFRYGTDDPSRLTALQKLTMDGELKQSEFKCKKQGKKEARQRIRWNDAKLVELARLNSRSEVSLSSTSMFNWPEIKASEHQRCLTHRRILWATARHRHCDGEQPARRVGVLNGPSLTRKGSSCLNTTWSVCLAMSCAAAPTPFSRPGLPLNAHDGTVKKGRHGGVKERGEQI